jgi:hypothetical protein
MLKSRRRFLAESGFGVGSLALAWMLNHEQARATPRPELAPRRFDLLPKPPQHEPKAKAMISLFMQGGPSHIDLFDPKPAMARYHLQPFPGDIKYDNAAEASAKVFHSPWKFRKCGQAGIELSELVPALAEVIDDVCLIRSTRTGVNNHGQSINALHNGRILAGRPVLGSWLTYALGTESQNLPAYVVLADPVSHPVLGVDNWSNGWLPSLYQGAVVRAQEPRILNLDPPPHLRGQAQENYLHFLGDLNRAHAQARPGEQDLESRIASFELAARMQLAAREAMDISNESAATKKVYGIDNPATAEFGTRCLIARRLVERGVRFVQICTRNQYWDHHGNIATALPASCRYVDRGSAGLVKDLQARGLLDSTLVHWGGEMGRLPVIQNERNIGRDHNTYGFTMWLAGGGIKGGMAFGATDDFGHHAVSDVVNHYDFHATVLHLFGLDPAQVTFARNGQQLTLLDGQPGRVIREVLR